MRKEKISLLKLKSLHGIKLNHRLCYIICVKVHKETRSNIRDNWWCLETMDQEQSCAAGLEMVRKCRFVSLVDVEVDRLH